MHFRVIKNIRSSMNIEAYQDRYGKYQTSFTDEISNGFNSLKNRVHVIVDTAVSSIKGPILVVEIIKHTIQALMYIPELAVNLATPSIFLKEIKNISYFIKGMKSVDFWLNFKSSWKLIVLNVSGLVLFVLSAVTLAEKFMIDVSRITKPLSSIPIFGTLPFGGLLHISLVVFYGTLTLLCIDKIIKHRQAVTKINNKIELWNKEITINKSAKYEKKISALKQEITLKEVQLRDAKAAEKDCLSRENDQLLSIHQQSLAVLHKTVDDMKFELYNLEKTKHKWEYLEKNQSVLDPQKLKEFQEAKKVKWQLKLEKHDKENVLNFLDLGIKFVNIAERVIIIAAVTTGIGLAILGLATLATGIADNALSVAEYFQEKSVKELKINPINVEYYFRMP